MAISWPAATLTHWGQNKAKYAQNGIISIVHWLAANHSWHQQYAAAASQHHRQQLRVIRQQSGIAPPAANNYNNRCRKCR